MGIKLEPLLIKPLSLLLQEIRVSDEHSSDLTQVLAILSFLFWAVCLQARAGFQVLNSCLNQLWEVFAAHIVRHRVRRPVIINNLKQSGWIFSTYRLTVWVNGWADTLTH